MPNTPLQNSESYAVVLVHAWSFEKIGGPLEAVRRTIQRLPEKTRVVSIEDLITLLRENLRPR